QEAKSMASRQQPQKKKKNLQNSGVRALDFRDHKAVRLRMFLEATIPNEVILLRRLVGHAGVRGQECLDVPDSHRRAHAGSEQCIVGRKSYAIDVVRDLLQ